MSSKRREIPVYETPLVETHCHLDYLKQDGVGAILERAATVGVERFVTIAVTPDNLDTVREIAAEHAMVFATQGVHPHDASDYSSAVATRIRDGLKDPNVVAVGEIGLDYHYDNSPRDVQRQVFSDQLAIAVENNLPVVIHTRDADDDTRDILAEYAPQLARKGVIHSFTSGAPLAEFCLEQGFHLGFNGIVTFNKAENVRHVVGFTPIEQMLVETDSPFLTPVPYRGTENAPFYIPFVAERLAEEKGVPIEEMLGQLRSNSWRLFWPGQVTGGR